MQNDTTTTVHVGLDVHKDSIVAAYSVGLGEVQNLGNVGVLERDITKLCTRMQSKGPHVSFVYEAGPTGYGLYRLLTKKGFACMVCAPSLTPRKPDDRVKTDRRDAIKLVKALRMNNLTCVHPAFGHVINLSLRALSTHVRSRRAIELSAARLLPDREHSTLAQSQNT